MTRKYHIHTQKANRQDREEELHITITRHQEDKQSNAASSPFPIKMIAKLGRIHSNVQQNMEQTQNPTRWSSNQQRINNNRTDKSFLVFCMEKQYSENVSIDAIDNNNRLKH